jgi:hypothetical protein
MEWPPTVANVNLRTDRSTGGVDREEMWIDTQNGRERIADFNGPVVGDQVWSNHYKPTSEAAAVDHVYVSLATNFRAALRRGTATLVGRGSFGGRDIDWLGLRQLPVPSWRHGQPWPQAAEDVGVDAHTVKPVALRFRSRHGTRGGYYGLVVSAKAIAYRPLTSSAADRRTRASYQGGRPRALRSA